MDKHFVYESIGYAASALIAVSMMMSSIVRLRVINLLGGILFAIYGLLIGAPPVAFLNFLIAFVNLVFLVRLLRAKEYFKLLPLKPDSEYLPYFLKFYRQDIVRILPDFVYRPSPAQVALFVLRDCSPVAVFIAEPQSDGVLRVVLDFVIPHYRDVKMGRFLFVEQADFFRARGTREIVVAPRTKEFSAYLTKVGFEPQLRREGAFHFRYTNQKPSSVL